LWRTQLVCSLLATFRYQSLQPGVGFGQVLRGNLSQIDGFIEEFLKGKWFVSAIMTSVGSGLPMGPRKKLYGISS
jgi:hypothetical protein